MASGREVAKRALQQVRPVLSVNKDEARRRVLNLYKAWFRQIPLICEYEEKCHCELHTIENKHSVKKEIDKMKRNIQTFRIFPFSHWKWKL